MKEKIPKLIAWAGNAHRYQYFMLLIIFFYWVGSMILSFSLPFLENVPMVSYYDETLNATVVVSLDYDICKWDEDKYTIVETYEYSWLISLELCCDQLKVSIIGTFLSFGLISGAMTYAPLSKAFGQRKVLLAANLLYIVVLIISFFVNNYYYYVFLVFISMLISNVVGYIGIVFISEIISLDLKSNFSSTINSSLGIGGIFSSCLYLAFKNWKYVMVVTIGISVVLEIVTYFYFFDSLHQAIEQKQFNAFMERLRFIAKFNKRLDFFNSEIEKEEYKEILNDLQSNDIQEEMKHVPLPQETPNVNFADPNWQSDINDEINNEKGKYHNGERNANSQEIKEKDNAIIKESERNPLGKEMEMVGEGIAVPNNPNNDINKNNNIDNNDKNSNPNRTEPQTPETQILKTPYLAPNDPSQVPSRTATSSTTNSQSPLTKQTASHAIKPNYTICSIFKYPSIRLTFVLFSFLWFSTNIIFNGLTIGIKSLPGSIYINAIIIYTAETPGYFISGFLMNSRLGRKYSLMLFTGCYTFTCLLLFFFYGNDTATIVTYLFTRFFVMSAFCVYYTFCLESYPRTIGAVAFGFNGSCNSFGGMVIPFVIEYIHKKTLYMIYTVFGAFCTCWILLLNETRGKEIPKEIKEIEELKMNKGVMKNIPVVAI